jgi:hypothetical protein
MVRRDDHARAGGRAASRIQAKGIHQRRSFVGMVAPNDHGISPRDAVQTNPTGPKILPSSPTRTIGQ